MPCAPGPNVITVRVHQFGLWPHLAEDQGPVVAAWHLPLGEPALAPGGAIEDLWIDTDHAGEAM